MSTGQKLKAVIVKTVGWWILGEDEDGAMVCWCRSLVVCEASRRQL